MASEPSDRADEEADLEAPIEARLVALPTAAAPTAEPSTLNPEMLHAPQWLHPSSILFELLSTLRQFIFAAIVALFMASSGNRYAVLVAGSGVAITATRALLRFLTLRYQLVGGELRINEGLLFRRHRTVPVARIQNIDLLQNPLHHAFGVAEVRVETAGGSEPEAKLRVLSLSDVARLRRAIFHRPPISDSGVSDSGVSGIAGASSAVSDSAGADAGAAGERLESAGGSSDWRGSPQWSYRIATRRLILAGLLSNRGLVLIPILFGLIFQLDLEEHFDLRHLHELLPSDLSTTETVAIGIPAAIAVLGLLRIASGGWFLFRFHGYALERYGEDLRISCGLFTRVSATVPRHRIQFISIQQTLLGRIFGLATIRIETASGGGNKNEDAAETVARRWFVPVMKLSDAATILPELRQGLTFQPEATRWQSTSPRTARRLCGVAGLRALLVGGIGLLFYWPWGWLAGVAALPPLVYLAIRYARSLKYARSDQWVVFRSGILNRKTSLTFYDKVQTVAVTQSPFDRRWGMATLHVDTAAAGPAQHRIEVKYLPTSVATDASVQIATRASKTPDALHVRPLAHHFTSPRGVPGDGRWGTGTTTELVDQ